ncbi:MAG TPA: hypothetical protein VIB79_30920 [Candidatus Binatia bacterium]
MGSTIIRKVADCFPLDIQLDIAAAKPRVIHRASAFNGSYYNPFGSLQAEALSNIGRDILNR